MMNEQVRVLPEDGHNLNLVTNVHPGAWQNPEPAGCYNLVVVGAGTAGLVSAAAAAGLGARVALVERRLLGGDCLNVGCVPSKGVIRAARAAHDARSACDFGVPCSEALEADFAAAMERMRRLRASISRHDSAARFTDELGVDVFFGEARFTSPRRVEVDGRGLKFNRAVIASGARAAVPRVEGLVETGYRTNETIFELTERPGHLVVVGGGPLGCELAQAFRRLGSEVTIIQRAPQFLSREDPDAAAILAEAFRREEIRVLFKADTEKVSVDGGRKKLTVSVGGEVETISCDEILVAVGRSPNVEDLDLEAAGVVYDRRRGVVVDDHLRTSNRRIYAAGDVCLPYKFTHTADDAARIVVANALFGGRRRFSSLTIPWCTYTDPEVAHVGMYAADAAAAGMDIDTFIVEMNEVDRAVLDGEEEGFVKVHVKKGTDVMVGATIVAPQAGKMISELTLAMVGGVGLKKVSSVIHPYPTQSEAIRKVADLYNRTRLTPGVRRLFQTWFRLMRCRT